jgi:hypothetical protein
VFLKVQALLLNKRSSSRRFKTRIVLFLLTLLPLTTITVMQGGAQKLATDPGPQSGSASTGRAFQGLKGGPGLNTGESLQKSADSPQVVLATLDGAANTDLTLSPSAVPCARRDSS